MDRHLLILGGTGEALALARGAAALDGVRVTTSLAGRTRRPEPPAGELRTGGFGGPEGLADYIRGARVDLLIDATHPFAAQMSRHAAAACAETGVPRLTLLRQPWPKHDGDRWIEVDDVAQAAAVVVDQGPRVFLTLGGHDLTAFKDLPDLWFLVRAIDPPDAPPPLAKFELITARGPFDVERETDLLRRHEITSLVARNSGGPATYAKIAAARALGLPVIVIGRPSPPDGETVATADAAIDWLRQKLR